MWHFHSAILPANSILGSSQMAFFSPNNNSPMSSWNYFQMAMAIRLGKFSTISGHPKNGGEKYPGILPKMPLIWFSGKLPQIRKATNIGHTTFHWTMIVGGRKNWGKFGPFGSIGIRPQPLEALGFFLVPTKKTPKATCPSRSFSNRRFGLCGISTSVLVVGMGTGG